MACNGMGFFFQLCFIILWISCRKMIMMLSFVMAMMMKFVDDDYIDDDDDDDDDDGGCHIAVDDDDGLIMVGLLFTFSSTSQSHEIFIIQESY